MIKILIHLSERTPEVVEKGGSFWMMTTSEEERVKSMSEEEIKNAVIKVFERQAIPAIPKGVYFKVFKNNEQKFYGHLTPGGEIDVFWSD